MRRLIAAMIVGLVAQVCCGQTSFSLASGSSAYLGGNYILYTTYSSGSGTPGYPCSFTQNNGYWDIAFNSTSNTFILWNCSSINQTATFSWNLIGSGSGGGGTTTNYLTLNNSGSGASSGTQFNGAVAVTLSYNTIGAAPVASPTFTGIVTSPKLTLTGALPSSTTTGILSYGTLGFSDSNQIIAFQGSVNSYIQNILQNTNTGTSASADYIVANNNSTNATYYGDFGINGGNFSGTGNLTGLANETYLYSQTGDLGIGTGTANNIHLVTDNSTVDAITITSSGATTAGVTTIRALPILSSSTAHGILLGEGVSAVSQIAVCGANYPIVGQSGADPICSSVSYPSVLTNGGLLYGSSSTSIGSDSDFTIVSHTLSGGSSALVNLSATNALTLSAMSGTSCLEEVSGLVTATGSLCGSGSGGVTSVSGTTNEIDVATGTTTPVISLDPNIIYPGIFEETNTGTFTGATSYSYLSSLINGCNPQTEWLAGQGTGNFTAANVNCVTGPTSPTNLTWGGMDFVSTDHAGLPDTAARYMQCRVLINSGICYDFNLVSTDNGTLTSGVIFRNETDLDPNGPVSAYTSGVGMDYEIYNTLHTGTFPFIGVTFGTGETGVYWLEGISFKQGAFGSSSIGINMGAEGTAISGTNYSSPIYDRVYGSFWNGTSATNDYWQTQLFVPSGTSPNFTEWYISHGGATYGYYTFQNDIDLAMVHSDNLTFDLIAGSSATGSTFTDTLPGATGTFAVFSTLPTNGNCTQWVVSGGIATLGQASGACGSGSSAFSSITSGTNTAAAMLVGSGASLGVTGSGTIAATTAINMSTNGTSLQYWGMNSGATAQGWQTITALTNPMTTLGDTIYGGASGAGTRLAGPTSGAGTYFLIDVPTGSSAVAETWSVAATGTGAPVLAGSPTFTGVITTPAVATNGSTQGFDALGVGTGSITVTLPTYYSGWIGPPSGTAAFMSQMPSTAPTVPSVYIYAPPTTVNGVSQAAETTVPWVSDTTITVSTTTINANSCSSAATATMTGVTTAMTFTLTPSTDIHSVTGWSAAGATLYFVTWPTANTLNYYVCNNSSSNITPGASTTWNVSAK